MQQDTTKKVVASLLSILAGLVFGGIVVLIVGLTSSSISVSGAWDGIRLIFAGILSTGRNAAGQLTWGFNSANIGNMLFRATPLIMTGLSVALANKAGLFNIGAPGQYLMGTMATLAIALGIPAGALPGFVVWLLAFFGGMLAGAVWGAVPGFVKAFLNINEVLACIMTNWIAANLVTWFFESSPLRNTDEYGKASYIKKTVANAVSTSKLGLDKIFKGSQVNAGIIIAIIIAIAVFILLSKMLRKYPSKLTEYLHEVLISPHPSEFSSDLCISGHMPCSCIPPEPVFLCIYQTVPLFQAGFRRFL